MGTVVGSTSASDDSGDPVTYEVTEANYFFALDSFAVDETGAVTVVADLSGAAENSVTMTVAARDADGGEATVEVTVRVTTSCSSGTAVPNPTANLMLVVDCKTLLALQDALAGTATLNWNRNRAMSSWDGTTLRGTPRRVTRLVLEQKGLAGVIPAELDNLDKLQTLYLGGNQFTGCIPPALRDVDENDLDRLDLPNCAPDDVT